MTYDYHGSGIRRPVMWLLSMAIQMMTIPTLMQLYGQSFTLTNKEENGLNAPAKSGGKAGPATRAKGFLAYHEICRNIASGWTVVKDDATPARMGPYAYN